jgi:hypothetical protein
MKAESSKNPNPRKHGSLITTNQYLWLVRIAILIFAGLCAYSILFPYYKLIDDPSYLKFSHELSFELKHEGLLSYINSLFTRGFQGAGRLLPVYFFYRSILYMLFGSSPLALYIMLAVLLICILQIQLSIIVRLGYSCVTGILAIVLFCFFSSGEWGSTFMNWNDLSTFEPLQLVFLSISVICYIALRTGKKDQKLSILYLPLLGITSILFYFSKETGIALAAGAVVFLAFEYFYSRRVHRATIWFAIIQVVSCAIFLVVYFITRQALPGQATRAGAFSFSLPDIWQAFSKMRFMLNNNYGLLYQFLLVTYLVRLVKSIVLKNEDNNRILLQTFFLFIAGALLVILLPFQDILEERMLVVGIFPLSIFLAIELTHVFKVVGRDATNPQPTSLVQKSFFVILSTLCGLLVASIILQNVLSQSFYSFFIHKLIQAVVIGAALYIGIFPLNTHISDKALRKTVLFVLSASLLLFVVSGFISYYNFVGHQHVIYNLEYNAVRRVAETLPPESKVVVAINRKHYFPYGMEALLQYHFDRDDIQCVLLPLYLEKSTTVTNENLYVLHIDRLDELNLSSSGEFLERMEPLWIMSHSYAFMAGYNASSIREMCIHIFKKGSPQPFFSKRPASTTVTLFQVK